MVRQRDTGARLSLRDVCLGRYLESRWEPDTVQPGPKIESANRDDTFEAIIRPFGDQKFRAPTPLVPSGTGNARFWVDALRANQEIVDTLPQLFEKQIQKDCVPLILLWGH